MRYVCAAARATIVIFRTNNFRSSHIDLKMAYQMFLLSALLLTAGVVLLSPPFRLTSLEACNLCACFVIHVSFFSPPALGEAERCLASCGRGG